MVEVYRRGRRRLRVRTSLTVVFQSFSTHGNVLLTQWFHMEEFFSVFRITK